MRIKEVHRNAGLLAELLVHGPLSALVLGHAQPQALGNIQQLVREGLQHIGDTRWFDRWQLNQHD